ncbi:MAG: hypothetical protein Q8K75_11265 [Chlamydiales bacterium]|nr:hypothetical protein [Chlamydiales bacterium]
MSSPIGGGGDVSQVYQPAVADTDDLGQIFTDGRAAELQGDSISKSTEMDKQIKSLSEDSSSPKLFPSNEQANTASKEQVKDLQQTIKNLAGGDVQAFLQGLPPEVQQAIKEGNPDAQMLLGNVQGQKQLEALASLGLQTVPDVSNLNLKGTTFPGPGPIDSTAPLGDQMAQILSNQVDSSGKAMQMAGAEAAALPPGTPGGDSLAAFLSSISGAISKLQEYLGTVQQADLKGNAGQAVDAGSDRGQLAQSAAAEKKESGGGGLFGGLGDMLGGIPIIGDLLGGGGGGLGGLTDMFSGIPIIGDLLGGGGGGGIGDMFSGLMGGDVPILGDMLKGLADMTSGIPIIGDLMKTLGDNPMMAVVGAVTFVAVTAMAMCTGPFAPLIGAGAAALVMGGMGMMSGEGGMGDMFKDIPILGDLMGSLGGIMGGGGGSSKSSSSDEEGASSGGGTGGDMLGGLMGGGGGTGGDMLGGIMGGGGGSSSTGEGSSGGGSSSSSSGDSGGGGMLGGLMGGGGGGGGGGDGGMLGGILPSELPLVGGMVSGVTDMFSGIPLIGGVADWVGDNQGAALLTGVLSVVAFPFAPLLTPLIGMGMMGLTGGMDQIPILGDLLGGDMLGGIMGGGGSSDKAAQQSGQSNAVADAYGSTAQKIAEESGVSEENSEIVGQLQKLISMLVAIKAAAAGGGTPTIPTDQMLAIVQDLSAQGVGGAAFQQAIAAGQSGDSAGMVNALSQGFADAGGDPTAIAGAVNAGGEQIKSSSDLRGDGFADTIMSLIPA